MSAWYAVGGARRASRRRSLSCALCSHWAAERRGKWKHSIGNHPRSGANGLSTSAWLPRVSRISGCPRWTILRIGLYSDAGSLIGASAEKRTVIRSANCSSPGLGKNTRRNAPPSRSVGHGGEHVGQRRAARPPELVSIGVDHPVGPVVGGREPRHARHPFVLTEVLAGLADQVDVAGARVPLEHLGRPVLRAVVGRDDEVGACVQVEREPGVDDVSLVAREERHDQLHRRASLRSPARGPCSSAEPRLERLDALARPVRRRRSQRARALGGERRVVERRRGRTRESRRARNGKRELAVVARTSAARRADACRRRAFRPRGHARGRRRRRQPIEVARRSVPRAAASSRGAGAASARSAGSNQPPRRLPLELCDRAEREVQDLDRVPAA